MELIATFPWQSAGALDPARARPVGVNTADDEALMLRYRDGDDEAFRLLYLRYRAPLLRFSQRLCGRASEAEEIFQETWIGVIHARERYSVRAKFVTWLFAIAHR